MTRSTAAKVAWTCFVLNAAFWAASFVLWRMVDVARVPTPGRQDTIGLLVELAIGTLVLSATGAVIAAGRPDNPVGWILAAAGVVVAVKSATGVYADHGWYVHGGRVAGWAASAWLSNWVWLLAMGPYTTFLFLLFPTGRPPSRRWRIAGYAAALGIAAASMSAAFERKPLDQFSYLYNPLPAPAWAASAMPILDGGFMVLLGAAAASVASLVVRFRRAPSVEREQVKWVAFAGVFLVPGFAFAFITERFDEWNAPFVFGPLAGIGIAAAIAIRRYRLFDIDRVVSRTVAYAIVTALLGGVFAIVVLVPAAIVGPGARTPDWLIAGATLAVAALFRPIRRRVQSRVDRRFNRARYDAAHTLEAFSTHMRDEVDIDTLGAELQQLVGRTMQPSHISLWLKR